MKTSELQNIKQRYSIVGNCEALNNALDVALKVAPIDLSVLIIGESGVGKDILPRIIHDNSPRRREKYFAINCGAIPEGTIDSELFGHVKGSFTGAVNDSQGYFGVANKGTLFLDEVGELPMATQARLLRVLENGEYIPVGGTEIRKTDVRIVAATNVNLEKAIREGRFRQDLYFRLSTVNIHVPALRERQEDIYLLFRKFASDMAYKYRMTEAISLTEDAKQMLLAYQWPGNVRQMLHIVEEISIIETERVIDAATLRRYLPEFTSGVSLGGNATDGSSTFGPGEKEMLYKVIFDMKRELEDVRIRLGLQTPSPTRTPRLPSGSSIPTPPAGSPIFTSVNDDKNNLSREKLEEVEEALEVEGNVVFQAPEVSQPPRTDTTRIRTMEEIEKEAIKDALRRNNGNKRKAAEELKISERTIHRWIKEIENEKD